MTKCAAKTGNFLLKMRWRLFEFYVVLTFHSILLNYFDVVYNNINADIKFVSRQLAVVSASPAISEDDRYPLSWDAIVRSSEHGGRIVF